MLYILANVITLVKYSPIFCTPGTLSAHDPCILHCLSLQLIIDECLKMFEWWILQYNERKKSISIKAMIHFLFLVYIFYSLWFFAHHMLFSPKHLSLKSFLVNICLYNKKINAFHLTDLFYILTLCFKTVAQTAKTVSRPMHYIMS